MKNSRQLIATYEKVHSTKLVEDGIIDTSGYHQSPYRILVITKPVNSNLDTTLDGALHKMLFDSIHNGQITKYWRLTYNNLVVGLHALVSQKINSNVHQGLHALSHSTIINIDKSVQRNQREPTSLYNQFKLQRPIIKAQIKELKPNIIICAGTYSLVEALLDEIYHLSNFQKERIPETNRVFWRGDPLIIDYFHPKYCISAEEYARGLLFAYKYWTLLKNDQTPPARYRKSKNRKSCRKLSL